MLLFNVSLKILCLWFRASLIYINNCPTRCNTKQSIYYSASSFHVFRVSTCLQRYQASLVTLEGGSCTKNMTSSCRVLEAVVTVLCTPDDGYGWHPKHVEWTCRIINRLLCVATCWTIINIALKCLIVLCYIRPFGVIWVLPSSINRIRIIPVIKIFWIVGFLIHNHSLASDPQSTLRASMSNAHW